MRRSTNVKEQKGKEMVRRSQSGIKKNKSKTKVRDNNSRDREESTTLDSRNRDNNPNWYFKNAMIADQVSQLSMREFLGRSLTLKGSDGVNIGVSIPPIGVLLLNPSAGFCSRVTDLQTSAINQASFKVFSRLASFTGRALTYAPQDIAMMLLAMGEVITQVEWIRRAFGLAYTYNQRNRAYPVRLFEVMRVDPEDFFNNYALYRNRFNALITRINQIPIPKSVAYFDKCAALYEKAYLDADSTMAQTWLFMPSSTWILDEESYEEGTILKTTNWSTGQSSSTPMSFYLDILDRSISALLGSSTLNVIYADIMNYYNKVGGEVWLFDYLSDSYQVIPEFNLKMAMQIHNLTTIGTPALTTLQKWGSGSDQRVLTPYNDVYPDANRNLVLYAPGFPTNTPHMEQVLIDFETNNPSVEDRIENTRFMSLGSGADIAIVGVGTYYTDITLADHYVLAGAVYDNTMTAHPINTVFDYSVASNWDTRIILSNFDWAPILYPSEFTSPVEGVVHTTPRSYVIGDVNYFTTVDLQYLKPINDIVYLDLFDLF